MAHGQQQMVHFKPPNTYGYMMYPFLE